MVAPFGLVGWPVGWRMRAAGVKYRLVLRIPAFDL